MRILFAEDERDLNHIITKKLTSQGYSVDSVYDGEEAIDILSYTDYDAVILDIMMPKADGFAVLRALRSKGKNTPVLFLTARDSVQDRVAGLDSGANDYLVKPFSVEELLARIRAMTRSQTEQGTSVLTVGNISLDRATYELSSPYGSFRLANKEFQMLELLMCNPKQLISTERFMERIWGYDSDTDLSVVWVYISYLRKKLSAIHANIQIKVTRNAGYSLEEEYDSETSH